MKKFIITLLAVVLAVTGTFTCLAASQSKDYSGLKDAIRKYRNVPDSYTDNDIYIKFYKTLSNGTILTKFSGKEFTYIAVMLEYNVGDYEYITATTDEAYIYDGKKIYDLETAYKRKIIDDKTVKEITKIFPDKFEKPKFPKKVSLKAGQIKDLKFKNKVLLGNEKSSNKKVASVCLDKVTALKKGTSKITLWLGSGKKGKKVTLKLTVTSNPKLTKNSKKISAVNVKKGNSVSVKIKGKAKNVDNVYKNTKYAKVTSKPSAKVIKVKGIKKGTSNLKVKVNGKKLSLKVNVV